MPKSQLPISPFIRPWEFSLSREPSQNSLNPRTLAFLYMRLNSKNFIPVGLPEGMIWCSWIKLSDIFLKLALSFASKGRRSVRSVSRTVQIGNSV